MSKYKFIILLIIICCSFSTVSHAAFEDLGVGARVLGMGNAFAGLADNVATIYYNPAGLAQLSGTELEFNYAQYYPGLTYNDGIGDGFIAYSQVLGEGLGTIGAGYLQRYASDLYRESTILFSYGKKFKANHPFCVGISLKYLLKSYKAEYDMGNPAQLDPVFSNGTSAYGFSLDIGYLRQLNEFSMLGISFTDVNQPDISLSSLSKDMVPFGVKIGYSYKFGAKKAYAVSADAGYRDEDYKFSIGLENWITFKSGEVELEGYNRSDQIGWRLGTGLGTNNYRNLSGGISYRMGGPDLEFDYAFIYPLATIKNTWGTHRVSMIMRFGNTKPN